MYQPACNAYVSISISLLPLQIICNPHMLLLIVVTLETKIIILDVRYIHFPSMIRIIQCNTYDTHDAAFMTLSNTSMKSRDR
jgi:hypothetical protein